ncbi:MAG: hypothetical protein WBW73_20110, partial [Rhodoplanes sp.]
VRRTSAPPVLSTGYGNGVQRYRLLGKPRGGNRIGIIGITTASVARGHCWVDKHAVGQATSDL